MSTSMAQYLVYFILVGSLQFMSCGRVPLNRTRRGTESGKCLLSGVCQSGDDQEVNGYIPCAVESDHHKFDGDDGTYQILKDECAELFAGSGDQPEVCCTAQELLSVQTSINAMTKFFSDCPSCVANIREIFCHFSCAPNQDSFLEIVSTTPSGIAGKEMVTELNYYVDRKFIDALWSSCKASSVTQQFLSMSVGCSGECTMDDYVKAIGMKSLVTPYKINWIMDGKDAGKYTLAPLTSRTCTDGCDSTCGVDVNDE